MQAPKKKGGVNRFSRWGEGEENPSLTDRGRGGEEGG